MSKDSKCIVVVRVRGASGIPEDIEYALNSLRLSKKYSATIFDKKPEIEGMLKKAKDMITWGKANERTIELLLAERGKLTNGKKLTDEFVKEKLGLPSIRDLAKALIDSKIPLKKLWEAGMNRVFRLHPPKGGFKRSIKRQYKSYGELGDRGEAINKLIEKMV
ncbi:MAG: 50S ribosomal protein L30 [Candidatus Bathyarchaeia archaeon]